MALLVIAVHAPTVQSKKSQCQIWQWMWHLHCVTYLYAVWPVLYCKMPMFQRVGIRKGGGSLPLKVALKSEDTD